MYATWLGCSNRAVFCSVSLVAFWQKRSWDQPETAPWPDRGTDQQNRRSDPLQSWSSIPLQVKSVCAGIFQIFVVCWSKLRFNHRQASRHCQEILSKCSWHEPRAARLTHTPSLFCFCGPVTSKMSHGVNKSCITQHVAAQGGYASEVFRNSQNTAWRCRKKLCFFFFLNQPLHASCVRPGPGGHI